MIFDAPGVENEKLWVILYLDGYGSHALNPEALEILHDGCIYCVGMPSHTSQAVQALDRSVFSGTKRCMRSEVAAYQFKNDIREICRWDIPSLFQRAWESSATADNAASGFDVCGVYPLRTGGKARLVWPGRAPEAAKKNPAPDIGTWRTVIGTNSTDETNRASPGEAATRLGGRVSTRTGPGGLDVDAVPSIATPRPS